MQFMVDKNNYKTAKRYADALVLIAKEKGLAGVFYEDLLSVFETVKNAPDFKETSISPSVSVVRKKEILKEAFENNLNPYVLNFLYILVESKHFDILETILYCFVEETDKINNIVKFSVTSAVELARGVKAKILAKLQEKTGKNVQISYLTEPEIIAGLVIQEGDKIADMSLKNKFDKLERELI